MTAATPDRVRQDREPLRQVDYSQVQLTGGPFGAQYEATLAYFLAIPSDRMLKVYRERAGLPAPGPDMGGWYDLEGFTPGAFIGHYMSGLARFGASTGDDACHRKVRELLDGFEATLGPDNQSILRPETNLWILYTLDKHFAGLIDAAMLSGLPEAKDVLNRVLAGAERFLPAEGRDRVGKTNVPYDETYVMPENLFTAAELTGNPSFHELAIRYLLDREFFDPLAAGDDPLPGQHAYSHAVALSSAGKAWLSLGDEKYLRAMENAFTLLTTQQQYASGAWGPEEMFVTPHKGELYKSLSSTLDHFETPCGAYAATKLARYLIRSTAEPADTRYGDYLERVLYNTILGVRKPDTEGNFPYYSTYSPAATKVFYHLKWPCCSGTLIETVSDYPLDLYFESADGLYVNGYTPSRLAFEHGGVLVRLVQETSYPVEDTTSLTLQPDRPVEFTVHLRIPAWLAGPATITVDGEPAGIDAEAGTWAAIRRTWSDGDRIELTLPQSFRTEPIDDLHPDVVALMRGPVMYVAINPTDDLAEQPLALPDGLERAGSQVFVTEQAGRRIVFVPFNAIGEETYNTYFKVRGGAPGR